MPDYLIVLGHKLNTDGSMDETLRLRLDKTLEVCRRGMPGKIIVSGGRTAEGIMHSEADKMAEYLEANGIPNSKIMNNPRASPGVSSMC